MKNIKFYDKIKMFGIKHNNALKVTGTILCAGLVVGAQYVPVKTEPSSIVMFKDIEARSINSSSSKPILQEIDYEMNVASDNEVGYETVTVKDMAYIVEDIFGNEKLLATRDLDRNDADIKQEQVLIYETNYKRTPVYKDIPVYEKVKKYKNEPVYKQEPVYEIQNVNDGDKTTTKNVLVGTKQVLVGYKQIEYTVEVQVGTQKELKGFTTNVNTLGKKAYTKAYLVYNEDGSKEYRTVLDLKMYAIEQSIYPEKNKQKSLA